MNARQLLYAILSIAVCTSAAGPYHSGFLTFSPDTPASSWACPSVHGLTGGVALNAVDFGPEWDNKCGQCIQIVTPRQFANNYPIVNVCSECEEGDIDLCNVDGSGRHDLVWKYANCRR